MSVRGSLFTKLNGDVVEAIASRTSLYRVVDVVDGRAVIQVGDATRSVTVLEGATITIGNRALVVMVGRSMVALGTISS